MNQITDGPNENYNFGQDFNYAVWPKDTVVSLVNVPWNNQYRDVPNFANRAAVDAYIDAKETAGDRIQKMSYLKPNLPVRVNIPINRAMRYNYLRASNPIQPVPGGDVQRNYYYFITNANYLAPNTTELTLQLDVFVTYRFDFTFGNCYIERGHIGIANTKAFNNYGRDYLTIPEGLDVGSEYQVVTKTSKAIMAKTSEAQTDPHYNVMVVSTTNLAILNAGDITSPQLQTATGGLFAGMPSGASQYLWPSAASFSAWLDSMKDKPWITQGIVSITLVPPIERYGIIAWASDNKPTPVPSFHWLPRVYPMLTNWRNSAAIVNNIPARYRGLKKLFTFPYMLVELTTFTGTPIMMKPESWNDPDATVVERINPVPPSQRVAVSPLHYNSVNGAGVDTEVAGNISGGLQSGDDYGEFLDLATIIANFPTLAIVNNGAISYLAANANGIAFQHQSADWSQQRALQGNDVAYGQATSGLDTTNRIMGNNMNRDVAATAIGNDLATQQAIFGSIMGVAGGAASGASAGGSGGAAIGAIGGMAGAAANNISTLMGNDANNKQLAVRNGNLLANTQAGMDNGAYVRDTNKSYADSAARGDYANSIAGINAKVRDAQLIQPTTSGQVGGDAMNFIHNQVVVSARFKMIDQAAIRLVGEYWLRYGYSVRKFGTIPASLMVMTKFTYWKLSETYILNSNIPEGMKQIIRGIFEGGVTVWNNPDDIGAIDIADNAPLGGITL